MDHFPEIAPLKVFPAGTNVRDIDIVDRGQKMLFTCKVHADTMVYASKDYSHSRWFLASTPGEKRECPCQMSEDVWVLAYDYKPTRND
ncbi:hypothetical protein SEA_WOLLYPOG_36 [Arthrobacter phage Wollypog]|uniref:Uncharacterized protein n=1 Tax=Arthrobacter phage Wollypog TaxID=2790985 RepID=A0A7T3KC89_9CAUD|nr:hypothetical protein PP291_gp36 [Arthrobacter phage Wollypog]QPX62588.1 hypothetical protein SEA_WOLLYPOG_36 [Arthrobacter phage Wollypog]